MKKMIHIFFAFVFFTSGKLLAQNQYFIKGFVYDAATQKPLTGVKADLKIADTNTVLQSTYTDNEGQFVFSISKLYAFQVQVSQRGYKNYVTSKFYFGEFQESYTLDKIYLQNNNSSGNAVIKVDTLITEKVIEKRMDALNILPTRGAEELFYALNPTLKKGEKIPENKQINYPKFPSFNESRQQFNKRFKKDKKSDGPYISLETITDPECRENLVYSEDKKILPLKNRKGHFFMNAVNQKETVASEQILLKDKPKKFVFVMWKTSDKNGEPITTGPDVTNRYLVKYYFGRNKGDTALYNRSSNATYGYAPMLDAIYNIEVYDQETGKKVRVSDDKIDPHSYFLRKDIWISLNIIYTKILIRVYD
jgi:hypothetical protein